MTAPTLADVVTVMEGLYPPETAEDWDSVGLVCGDPDAPVSRVLFAVDPVADVVDEALSWGADLVVTHHPLFLRGVHSVAATTFKGAVVHRLVTAGVALYNAHTNADAAARGVADALADAVGIVERRALVALADGAETGIGRVGRLAAPTTLGEFAQRVADALPPTAQGIRIAGDLQGDVSTVAVLGGSGDGFFDAVRAAGADAYVTSDLRHHPASELRERALFEGGAGGTPYLVDTAHFASEWLWLRYAATDVTAGVEAVLAGRGEAGTVTCKVSTRVSDPWTAVVHAQETPARKDQQ
jgi:dinuclear metal center YbgI/SA1388 family protein